MVTSGPCSQKPGQPVVLSSTFPSTPCAFNSCSKATATSSEDNARQPVPPQTLMLTRFGSCVARISSRFLSSPIAATDFVLAIRGYLLLRKLFEHLLHPAGGHRPIIFPVQHHHGP